MNTEEYISSGILEAYALGELTSLERSEVERNIALYPELKVELLRIELTQEKFLMGAVLQPSAQIKGRIWQKIESSKVEATVMSLTSPNTLVWKFGIAASLALTLVSSFLAYTYYGRWRQSENNLNELITQNQRIASEYNSVNQRLDKIESDIKVIDNPAFKRTVMNGTANAPGSMAYVYWNENTREVYLSIQSMKELAQENQYQLWAIVDGKPVDAGVFDSNVAGLLKMKEMNGAAAFAVTIEPRGGKTSPTLETMQVVGNVVKG